MSKISNRNLVIIGAGIQGTTLAARLAKEGFTDFSLLDGQAPMQGWMRATEYMQLEELRTPNKLHVGPEGPGHMLATMRSMWTQEDLDKPALLEDFNNYAASVVEKYGLQDRWIQGWVQSMTPIGDGGYLITTITPEGESRVIAEKVVIATGLGHPIIPAVGPASGRILHADGLDLEGDYSNWYGDRVCVVGGGLSAGTIADAIVDSGGRVVLCVPERLTVSQLEADPGWLPQQGLWNAFRDAESSERLKMLKGARVGRGVTPAVYQKLQSHLANGNLELMENTRLRAWFLDDEGKVMIPDVEGSFDYLLCATGFATDVTQVSFLEPVMDDLEVLEGLPVLDKNYQSTTVPGIYFMGRLGELSGGPLSRNVPGARHAAVKIARSVLGRYLQEDQLISPGTILEPSNRRSHQESRTSGGCGGY